MTAERFQHAVRLQQQGRWVEAESIYSELLAQDPGHLGTRINRALVLQKLKRDAEALLEYEGILALKPEALIALVNRALILHDLRRFDEALVGIDKALVLQPNEPRLHFNRANALTELCRFEEALLAFDKAVQLQPDFAGAVRNRGILKLLLGRFDEGWVDYERRRPADRSQQMLPGLDAPFWSGESLEGKTILVTDATGMGDAIHFCRYLPMLAARGAIVSFLGNTKLYRLFAALQSTVHLLPSVQADARFDFQCKLLSLPYRFNTALETIPAPIPYLRAEDERIARWAERIGMHGFRVGICWKGNPSRTIDAGRSMPLRGFYPLAQVPGVRLISLQKRFGLEELEGLPTDMHVETLGDDFDEGSDAFLDTAGAVQSLDLVISSDTSLAHLAGALGRPIWIGLKQVPEWRWMLGRGDTPWYPQARLFRQHRQDDWAPVFAEMRDALAGLTGPLRR